MHHHVLAFGAGRPSAQLTRMPRGLFCSQGIDYLLKEGSGHGQEEHVCTECSTTRDKRDLAITGSCDSRTTHLPFGMSSLSVSRAPVILLLVLEKNMKMGVAIRILEMRTKRSIL